MKKKDRYRILNLARNQYREAFGREYEFQYLSLKKFYELVKQYKVSACEWSYCCYGLEKCCWQEPIEPGVCGMSQSTVDDRVRYTVRDTAKICRKDNRILYAETDDYIHVVIIARDVFTQDYLLGFEKK